MCYPATTRLPPVFFASSSAASARWSVASSSSSTSGPDAATPMLTVTTKPSIGVSPMRLRTRSATLKRRVEIRFRHHDHKLIAAHPRHQIRRAQGGRGTVDDPSQRMVAGGVAVRVVDPLQVVDVDHQDGKRAALRRQRAASLGACASK
jgi:hypothetical protein